MRALLQATGATGASGLRSYLVFSEGLIEKASTVSKVNMGNSDVKNVARA